MLFGDEASASTLRELRDQWNDCRACPLRSRHVCHGIGTEKAKIVVVGQAPTANEGYTGKMMTDPGGRRIREWINNFARVVGLSPEDIYYSNVVKCPSVIRGDPNKPVARIDADGNRGEEVVPAKKCAAYLEDELELIKPELIIALGQKSLRRFASYDPLRKIPRILGDARGRVYDYNGYKFTSITMPIVLNEDAAAALDEDYEFLQEVYSGAVVDKATMDVPKLTIEQAFEQAADCTDCSLCRNASHKVFGTGNMKTKVMIVGEAPGQNEDRVGSPFVGQAGRVLHQAITDLGFDSKEVYITNTVQCWPGPGNPDPTQEQMDACRKYLLAKINHINPEVILAVGKKALNTLTRYEGPMGRVRGTRMRCLFHGANVVPTWHPAYVLRKQREAGSETSPVEEDFMNDLRSVLTLTKEQP